MTWLDFTGLLLFLAGLIVGLGGVCTIATLAFLGRKSTYWTEATIRAHRVTKPLIWLGWATATIGALVFYRNMGLGGIPLVQLLIFIPLTLNGLWLTKKVSYYLIRQEQVGRAHELLSNSLQRQITVSFIISLTTWWSEVILLVWHLLTVYPSK